MSHSRKDWRVGLAFDELTFSTELNILLWICELGQHSTLNTKWYILKLSPKQLFFKVVLVYLNQGKGSHGHFLLEG